MNRYTLPLVLLLTGCTFNITIDTDYAAQKDLGGDIIEEVVTNNTTKQDPNIDAVVEVAEEGL